MRCVVWHGMVCMHVLLSVHLPGLLETKISHQQNTIKHEISEIYLAKTLASENILPLHYIITNYFINKIKSWVLLFHVIKSGNEEEDDDYDDYDDANSVVATSIFVQTTKVLWCCIQA